MTVLMAATSAPFSYAQAAKGKVVETPSDSKVNGHSGSEKASIDMSVSDPEHEINANSGWGDDIDEPVVLNGEHGAHPSQSMTGSESHQVAGTVEQNESAQEASELSSPQQNVSASSSTVKDDDQASLTTTSPPEELPWRQRPKNTSSDAKDAGHVPADTNGSAEKTDQIKPTPAPFVEAPAPAVNFWTKRAQESRNQQPNNHATVMKMNGAQSGDNPDMRTSTMSAQDNMKYPGSATTENASSNGNGMAKRMNGDLPRSKNMPNQGNVAASQRHLGKTQVPPNIAQFPSLQDSQSWPTPNTTQGEGRRKSQEKSQDDAEGSRRASTTSNAHGKNNWVQLPITPSVKFETQLPGGMRRHPRLSAKPVREPSMRNAAQNDIQNDRVTPSTSGESTNAQPSRDRSTSSLNRSSPQATRAKPADVDSNNAPFKRKSLPNDRMMRADRTIAPDSQPYHKDPNHTLVNETGNPSDQYNFQDKPVGATSTTVGLTQNGFEPTVSAKYEGYKGRRKNSRASDIDTTYTRPGDRRRAGSINGGNRSSWGERRFDSTTRPFDPTREQYGAFGSRDRPDGRPAGRGRGMRERGNHFNPNAPPNLRINQNQLYFSNGPHSAKPTSYHSQTPGSSTFPRSGREQASRASSIPAEAPFGRFGSPYMMSPGIAPFAGPGYEYGPMSPSTAMQVSPQVSHAMLMNGVATQLNHYFSDDNLLKDTFLRQHMDSQGFVALKLVAGFPRMKGLTEDLEMIKLVAASNQELSLHVASDGQAFVRRRHSWMQWVLPPADRQPSAQRDGPPIDNGKTHPGPFQPVNGYLPGQVFQPSQPMPMAPYNFVPMPTSSPVNGYPRSPENRRSMPPMSSGTGLAPQSLPPPFYPQSGSSGDEDGEPDAYPDDKIDNQLIMFVRPRSEGFSRASVTRSFSNGTIDGVNLNIDEHAAGHPREQTNREVSPEASDPHQRSGGTGEKVDSPERTQPPHVSHNRTNTSGIFWYKDANASSEPPPGTEAIPYAQVYANAKQQRQMNGAGQTSWDMDLLYRFWTHFLLRNFNNRMYDDFRTFAAEDAAHGSGIGMDCLLDYYSQALFSQDRPIRTKVARDFVSLADGEGAETDKPAFRRLRAAWRNGEMNIRSRKVLQEIMSDDLRMSLDR